MMKNFVIAFAVFAALAVPAAAEEQKDLCSAEHMQKMDEKIAAMTDAEAQKSAKMHLDASKAEMAKNNEAGCKEHMDEAHKAMGM